MLVPTGKGKYYEGFKKVVDSSDVILQVLDARDPCSCRCLEVERYVRKVDANKRIILVLNKIGTPASKPLAETPSLWSPALCAGSTCRCSSLPQRELEAFAPSQGCCT